MGAFGQSLAARQQQAHLRRRAPADLRTQPPAAAAHSAPPCVCRGCEAAGRLFRPAAAGPNTPPAPPAMHHPNGPASHPPTHQLQRRLGQPPQPRPPLPLLLLQVHAVRRAAGAVLGQQGLLALPLPPLPLRLQGMGGGSTASHVGEQSIRSDTCQEARGPERICICRLPQGPPPGSAPPLRAAPAAGAAASPAAPAPPLSTCGQAGRVGGGLGAPAWVDTRAAAASPTALVELPAAAHSFSRWCSSLRPCAAQVGGWAGRGVALAPQRANPCPKYPIRSSGTLTVRAVPHPAISALVVRPAGSNAGSRSMTAADTAR